ncbi:MAG: phage tail protein [Mogibacterium sp.]|nr:phage tail protein [Mogibacterium sp.]
MKLIYTAELIPEGNSEGIPFYNSAGEIRSQALSLARLTLEQGTAGAFIFRIDPYNAIYGRDLNITDRVKVYREDKLLFDGRVISSKMLMNTVIEVKCEGLLAILNDSIFRPITYTGSLSGLVTALINSHNSQVDASKQISVGTIDVYSGDVYRAYENYESTWSRFADLVSTFGGFLFIREESGGLYLDYLADNPTPATQTIDFGQNLLDLTSETNLAEVITALIPLGAEQDDGTRLTIESVNSNSDTLISANATIYGNIYGSYIWDDVTVASNLKTKGEAILSEIDHPTRIINVTALDLAQVDSSIEFFEIGQAIQVSSSLHNIYATFILRSMNLDLINPANNKLSLGERTSSYIQQQHSSLGKMSYSLEAMKSATKAYIVEVGESNGWYYRKFSDGTYDAYKRLTLSAVACSSTWGSMYVTAAQTFGNRPSFDAQGMQIYVTYLSSDGHSGWVTNWGGVSGTGTGTWVIIRPTSSTSLSGYLSAYIHSNWS